MRNIIVLASLAVLVLVGGCGAAKWSATGGSKADGTVDVSYERNMMTPYPEDEAAALEIAIKRCKAWGYKNAEAFGGETQKRAGEVTNLVTRVYQCVY